MARNYDVKLGDPIVIPGTDAKHLAAEDGFTMCGWPLTDTAVATDHATCVGCLLRTYHN